MLEMIHVRTLDGFNYAASHSPQLPAISLVAQFTSMPHDRTEEVYG
ncbi:MAG TPA: hypothetical protein VF452_22860 [Candidatus Binatia bacterium]